MWDDALSFVRSVSGKVQSTVNNALDVIEGSVEGVDAGTDDLNLELSAYKHLLEEAQMQHVELSKQMRLLVAERDAEIAALRGSMSHGTPSNGDGNSTHTHNNGDNCEKPLASHERDELILNSRIEVEKSRAEHAVRAP
jgi:hypothetical protein